jgi:hypothetical protein
MLYIKKFRKRHENWFNIQSTFKILIMLARIPLNGSAKEEELIG